jgi:hypothetical protein
MSFPRTCGARGVAIWETLRIYGLPENSRATARAQFKQRALQGLGVPVSSRMLSDVRMDNLKSQHPGEPV